MQCSVVPVERSARHAAATGEENGVSMLVLVNLNRLRPPIAPVGLEYVASAAESAKIPTAVIDLGLAEDDGLSALAEVADLSPNLVGLSLRNIDDCFWPSATSYLPQHIEVIRRLRELTAAPIVVGGVGFSIFGRSLLSVLGADFGIRGDGEAAIIALYRMLDRPECWAAVPGLIWRNGQQWLANAPAFVPDWAGPRTRRHIRNLEYFAKGGQIGVETKRGCPRKCIYCADPVAKGSRVRCRPPQLVVEEFAALCEQGIDVFHLCDGEFNVPRSHALAVCEALIQSRLSERIRFYAYMAVRPFDVELAGAMRRAGCVGINFTGDSACDEQLLAYRAAHRRRHIADTVAICRSVGITCMVDLLLGGPGETPATVRETIEFAKQVGPDCVGAGLGMRLYPDTPVEDLVLGSCAGLYERGIRRRYSGPIELIWPTFYISPALGEEPARLVREYIAGDERFFGPAADPARHDTADDGHNYSDNRVLAQAIEKGARGAYWDILRHLQQRS